MSRRRVLSILGIAVIVIVIISNVMLSGCAKQAYQGPATVSEETMPGAPEMMADQVAKTSMAGGQRTDSAVLSSPEAAPQAAPKDRHLIRTGVITLHVKDITKSVEQVEQATIKFAGYISKSNLSLEIDNQPIASVTIRVPVARFDEAMNEFAKIGQVRSRSSEVSDVTGQYADLDARLRNSRREEAEILKLFSRSGKLSDIITVETKLSEVREKIETQQAQLRNLSEQTTYSTINLQLIVPYINTGVVTGNKFGEAVVNAVFKLKTLLSSLLVALIYILIVGAIIWLPLGIVLIVRRGKNKKLTP